MQTVLLAAAGSTRYEYVSPLVVLDEIVELMQAGRRCTSSCARTSSPAAIHDHKKLVDVARGRLFDRIDDEVRVVGRPRRGVRVQRACSSATSRT